MKIIHKKELKFLLLLLILLCSSLVNATDTIVYNESSEKLLIGDRICYQKDQSHELSYSDIKNNTSFVQSSSPLFVVYDESAFWIRFHLKNETEKDLQLLVENPNIDYVKIYYEHNGKLISEEQGDVFPFFDRRLNIQDFVFDLNLPPGESRSFYLEVKSKGEPGLPLAIGSTEVIQAQNLQKDLVFGIFFGILLAMFLYNLILVTVVKDVTYSFYILYILCIGMAQAALHGYGFKYFWPENPEFNNRATIIFSSLAGIFAIQFFRSFVQPRRFVRWLDNGLLIISVLYGFSLLLSFLNLSSGYYFLDFNALIGSPYVLICSAVIAMKGEKTARFFLIAWSLFLTGLLVYVLRNLGILPYTVLTTYTMQAGIAAESILLSLALADRINTLKKEKEESQAREVAALEENERIVLEQNNKLEQKVKERTSELEESNSELARAVKDLKEAQISLVESEKMASLGQLTAGVAHEINNPINFVTSSLKPLKRDVDEIFSVLSEYEKADSKGLTGEEIKAIEELKEEIEYDFLKEEIQMLLDGIDEGATRTAEIVRSLKTFSRVDESDLKRADIREGIDSTLVLLDHAFRDKVTVVKEYDDVPEIECFPGKLNQVFMNLLSNAAYASIKANQGEGPLINISVKQLDNSIEIRIKDNGGGIPENIRSKIFDPFFTTKPVGEGTGMGLAIVFSIIEQHQGTITLNTETGLGTEFTINLPVEHK